MSIFFEILVRIASYGPQIDQSHSENRLSHIIRSFMHHCHWFCLLHKRNKVKAFSWESGYEVTRVDTLARICCHRLPRRRIDRLPIVLCCVSLLRFIERAKKNQQCVGPLKWESGAKVTRCCLILFFELEKDLESQIAVAS